MEKINPRSALVFFVILTLSLFLVCFQPQAQARQTAGVYHLVKKNETIQMIAKAYGVPLQTLIKANNIVDADHVKEGYVMFIPSASRVIDNIVPDIKIKKTEANIKTKKYSSKKTIKTKSSEKKIVPSSKPVPDKKMQAGNNRFIWPVRGEVKDTFGVQPNKTFHNWIKITASAGAKVKAAESGTVIFSSTLKNYGEAIIIRHKNNFATVYTHLKKRYVKIDKSVR
ncbi:MAG: M23 family metallopeptidase, partial [Smithella sp.]